MGTTLRTPGAVGALASATRRTTATVALFLVLVVAALAALPGHPLHRTGGSEDAAQQVWREDWSRRFPGCVSVLLWPRGERPRALVVRDADGALAEVPARESGLRGGAGQRTVGVCR